MFLNIDNIILTGKNEATLKSVNDELSSNIKDLGKLIYFLGLSITCNHGEKKPEWDNQSILKTY